MNQNMTQALQTEGLAYYTRELKAITDMTAKKKQLEQFFWSFSQDDWVYPEDERGEETYRFSVSPAGNQSSVLELVVHCVTPEAEDLSTDQFDAVWLLTDGLFPEHAGEDAYTGFLREVLRGLAESGLDRPVCLILSQIERLGHFENIGAEARLPREAAERLTRLCREHFLASCGSGIWPVLIPVQVYGGLECVGADANGAPRMRIGQSGFYQSYLPENCQIPGLYTMQAIMTGRQQDFFPDNSLSQSIQHHYSLRFADAGWRPQVLGREEAP